MNEIYTTVLSYKTKAEDEGKTVEQILKKEFRFSAGLIKELKMVEKLKINGVPSRSVDTVRNGDIVSADIGEIQRSEIPEFDLEPEILFEDAHILVVNKPPGLSIHPCRGDYEKTLAGAIIHHWRKNGEEHNFHAVNRLDKNTSGICLIAKNRYSHSILSIQTNIIEKEYSAIVHGKLDKSGEINAPIMRAEESIIKRIVSEEGKPATTLYYPVKFSDKYTLVKIRLLTGRTHQIRVHFSYIGHPLFGDWLYGYADFEENLIARHALVSDKIKFYHPVSQKLLQFEIGLPEDMENLLEKL